MDGVLNAVEAKDCNIVTQVLNKGNAEQRVLIECDKLATKSHLVSYKQHKNHYERIEYRRKYL